MDINSSNTIFKLEKQSDGKEMTKFSCTTVNLNFKKFCQPPESISSSTYFKMFSNGLSGNAAISQVRDYNFVDFMQ